ncbi:NAD(P)/FAD-dependent oxidoreductase [Nodosilinea sp. PGN35]|uniref:NAD(P)/FAD-dependent oxidoreductase n=1 Tax=Nodosilinea sp. PGN35 TaxID=3020489 RepID=UPI0023B2CFEA|nr:NAD(P)/FAD-dependent oxidoreductase [Nodosilinea sp. TSF1-S3]MDF0367020.1 NAD(P)/FAD-dependent oxidoreductase [Nodosilinea sp. TSF1-S3]
MVTDARISGPTAAGAARPEATQHWGIVGGGLLGLTLALRLAQQGQRVTLYEAAPELGGLASAWRLDDLVWDRHYHVTLLSDLALRSLLTELGLEQAMRWVETKTGVYADGQLYSVSNAVEFLRFPPLGLIDKLRLGLTIVMAARIRNWQRLERIPVTTWLQRWSGRRTLRRFWLPLLRSKLGENYRKASAAFIWAIIARLYAARRTGLKQEMFGYLPGGYARLLGRFEQMLRGAGVELRLGCPVQSVVRDGDHLVVNREGGRDRLDRVVVTAPSPVAVGLCPQLTPAEVARHCGIQYQGILCASLLLRRPLSPYYVTNITDAGLPFTGVIEMTTLVNPAELGDRTLVYLPKYVDPHDPAFDLTDDQLQERFVTALEQMYPHFHRDDLLAFQVSRVRHVLAIATLNYSRHLPPMATSVPGLAIVNSAHILNGTLNVNETVQLANRAVQTLLETQPAPSAGGRP